MAGVRAHRMQVGCVPIQGYFRNLDVGEQAPWPLTVSIPRRIFGLTMHLQND